MIMLNSNSFCAIDTHNSLILTDLFAFKLSIDQMFVPNVKKKLATGTRHHSQQRTNLMKRAVKFVIRPAHLLLVHSISVSTPAWKSPTNESARLCKSKEKKCFH